MRLVLSLAVLTLVGCGKSGGAGSNNAPAVTPPAVEQTSSTSMLVADKASLPTCDSSRGGALAYVKSESKFYGCDGTSWAEVSIKGEKGDTGATGSDNGIAETYYCHTHMDNSGGVDLSTKYVYYWVSVTKSGDVFVNATVDDTTIGASNTVFYAKSQVGAPTGSVLVSYDLYNTNNSGYTTIEYNRTTSVGTIIYYDSEITGGSKSTVFGSSACSHTTY